MYADGVATCDQGAVADRPGGGGKADTPAMPDGYGKAAGDGATERLESGEGSLKEVKELGGILQALVGTAAKMCQSEKNNDTAVNEIRVIMSEEVEALSG